MDTIAYNNEFRATIENRVREDIARDGRSVIAVLGDKAGVGFAYTIGNHLKGIPELLLVANINPTMMQTILNEISVLMIEDPTIATKPELSLGGKWPLRLHIPTTAVRDYYTRIATVVLETLEYPVIQVICPDREGRYPGDPDCAHPYNRTPVL